jgi:hypothetical protein
VGQEGGDLLVLLAPVVAATDSTLGGIVHLVGRAHPWIRFLLDHAPLAVARRVRVPTLLLHGSTDRQVTVQQAAMLECALRGGGGCALPCASTSGLYPGGDSRLFPGGAGRGGAQRRGFS